MQTRVSARPGPRIRRVHAIINPVSGGVASAAAEDMAALFAEFGLDHRESEPSAGELRSAVRAALDTGPDLMVVLGGDGTTRLVAEMCGPLGPLIAPLSGGTMNKLDRGLYGRKSWREALFDVLAGGEERCVPGGEIAGRAFYCSAMLGFPAFGSRVREAFRAHRFRGALTQLASAVRRTLPARLKYEFDFKEIGHGAAVGLICPTVSRAIDSHDCLEAAVLDVRDMRAIVRLALHHLIGDWRDDPGVTTRACRSGRAWARYPIPGMLDGEYFRFGRQVDIRFRACGFRALAPSRDPSSTG